MSTRSPMPEPIRLVVRLSLDRASAAVLLVLALAAASAIAGP